jgi:cobalt-zinc-cadmium efflux system outer membrane protein
MKKYLLFLVALGAAGTMKLLAQEEAPVLSLKEAVETAMRLNPELQRMAAQLEGKTVEWKTALGLPDPELTFGREGISNNKAEPFTEQKIAIQQQLDFPTTTIYRLKRISSEKEALAREVEALKKQVAVEVKTRYSEVIYLEYIRKLRAETYRLSMEMAEAVKLRVESGVGTYIDQLSSEIRLVQSENEQYETERLYHEARYKLFNYIGLSPDQQRYDIRFADTLRTHNELIDQEVALYTLESQPMYLSAKALLQSADFGIREAKSEYLPNLRFAYFQQDFMGDGFNFRGVEGGVSIPLWGMFNTSGQVKMAQSLKQQYAWDLRSVELGIKEKIELAWHSYDNSQVTMQLYKTQLKEKSETLLNLTREAYRLGQIDLLKLIEAQQLYLSSQERFYSALRDYYLRLIELEQFVNQELVY